VELIFPQDKIYKDITPILNMKKERVLISSIFSSNTIKQLVLRTSPSLLILVVEKNLFKSKNEDELKKINAIKQIQQSLSDIIKIEILETKSLYDLYEITKDVVNQIDKLKNQDIILNISEGRKTLAFGMYFAGQLRKEKVSSVYYLIKEDNTLLKMPLPDFNINKVQKNILLMIKNTKKDIKELRTKIEKEGKSKSLFYKYIKQLEEEGYIEMQENKLEITNMGKMVLL